MEEYHRAPWSRLLIIVSIAASTICIGVAIICLANLRGNYTGLALMPVGLVLASALFLIRGYTVTAQELLVHRLVWDTSISLDQLRRAEFKPGVMAGSIRTFGNGGLFSFSGLFYNKELGSYRAYATDLQRTVVLHFPEKRIVISPDNPEEFVRKLNSRSAATRGH